MTGEELRALRLSRGLTQQTLADFLGVSRSLVANWETSRGLVPADYDDDLSDVRALPRREDARLAEHNRSQRARRAGATYLETRTCSVCGTEFEGPYWRNTCGVKCLRNAERKHVRTGLPRRIDDTQWPMVAEALSGTFTARALAERHDMTEGSVTRMLRGWGVSLLAAQRAGGLHNERDLRIARRFLAGDSLAEIAREWKISHQRVHQVIAAGGLSSTRRRAAAEQAQRQRDHIRESSGSSDALEVQSAQMLRRLEGAQMRDARIRAGLTEEDLANLLGVSQPTVSHWELGRWRLTRTARAWVREQLTKEHF